jgi:hypothetical protein
MVLALVAGALSYVGQGREKDPQFAIMTMAPWGHRSSPPPTPIHARALRRSTQWIELGTFDPEDVNRPARPRGSKQLAQTTYSNTYHMQFSHERPLAYPCSGDFSAQVSI